MKIVEETNYNGSEHVTGADIWKEVMSNVVTPFKDTPLYPFELE